MQTKKLHSASLAFSWEVNPQPFVQSSSPCSNYSTCLSLMSSNLPRVETPCHIAQANIITWFLWFITALTEEWTHDLLSQIPYLTPRVLPTCMWVQTSHMQKPNTNAWAYIIPWFLLIYHNTDWEINPWPMTPCVFPIVCSKPPHAETQYEMHAQYHTLVSLIYHSTDWEMNPWPATARVFPMWVETSPHAETQ